MRWLILCCLLLQEARAGYLYSLVRNTPEPVFTRVKPLYLQTEKAAPYNALNLYVSDYSLWEADTTIVSRIAREKPQALEMDIVLRGQIRTLRLLLNRGIHHAGLRLGSTTTTSEDDRMPPAGACYQGVITDDSRSVVAISFFENKIMGLIGTTSGNFVLGGSALIPHPYYVLYEDRDLQISNSLVCNSDELEQAVGGKQGNPSFTESISASCIQTYIEADYALYTANGSNLTQTLNEVLGLFNFSQTLLLNDSVQTGLKQVGVWTSIDPYAGATSLYNTLIAFGNNLSAGFNGDLAHLYSGRTLNGGIGWTGVLCFLPSYKTAVSAGLSNTLIPLPLYSWNAHVITHETGHNLGSPHTHACAWNGNNTRIDNCGGHASGAAPGSCADVFPDPPTGGTMMSYCHLLPVGVNLSAGFGPQPGMLIRAMVDNAACLGSCYTCQPLVTLNGNYSVGLTESASWISSYGQTEVQQNLPVVLDADPNAGYILFEASGSNDFFIANPSGNGMLLAQALDGCAAQIPARKAQPVFADRLVSRWKLSPVPADEFVTLYRPENLEGTVAIRLLSAEGRILWQGISEPSELKMPINLQGLSAGVYLLVADDGHSIEILKLIRS